MNLDYLTSFLDSIPTDGTPGIDCKIIYKHTPIYRHSAGYMDIETKKAIIPDARYMLYSSTKPITCATALTLYEQGKFNLFDNLYEYIPEFKDIYVKRYNSNGSYSIEKAKNPIKIVDLFTMSSGYSYDLHYPSIKKVQAETNGVCPTLHTIKAMATEPLEFEPGTHFMYGLSHDILGGLIEVITGKTLGEYMKEAILQPIGMKDTSFTIESSLYDKMPSQYTRTEQGELKKIQKHNMFKLGSSYESGGAGLISTTDDLLAFAECMTNGGFTRNGENILSRATIDLMRTNHLDNVRLVDFHSGNPLHRAGYGYGLGVRTMNDRVSGGINGSVGEFGWPGAAGTYCLMDPERELSVVFMRHLFSMETLLKVHPRLRNVIYACIEK